MSKKIEQYNQINEFLTKFTILQHNQESTVISGQNNIYLIRNIQISVERQRSEQLNQIINTLTQHQQFNSKSILSLLDFQMVQKNNHFQSHIRAIYQYGKKSLAKQIQDRKQSEQYFEEDALWGLLYSLATPLSYLQQKNIIYGVIDPSRVFLDKGIAILDPSSTGIDPYEISTNRLYSPELLKQQRCLQQIDMFKSDVFVLGLLMLQSALLKMQLYEYDQNVIKICLTEIQDIYSKQLCHLISSLLIFDASERPSFKQILTNLTDLLQISTNQIQLLEPLSPDKQNLQNQMLYIDEEHQKQIIDILQSQTINKQYQQFNNSQSDYQKAKQKFCYCSSNSRITEVSVDQSLNVSRNQQFLTSNIAIKSQQKSNSKVYKAKKIKDKLIRPQIYYHSSTYNTKQKQLNEKNKHRRSNMNSNSNQSINDELNSSQIMKNQHHSYIDLNNSMKRINTTRQKNYQNQKQNTYPHNLNQGLNHKDQYKNSGNKKIYNKQINLNNKENLFTKPQIMNMIKNDIKKIEQRKKNRMSVLFSYISQENRQDAIENYQMPAVNNTKNHSMSQQFQSGQFKSQPLSFNAIKSR